jgi:hypothetical protein
MDLPKPEAQHNWLQKFIGKWSFDSECNMGPDQPPGKFSGTCETRTLGGLWIIIDQAGEMPGGGIGRSLLTLGYDPAKKKFVGTFVGGMMTNLWVYEGSLDAAEKVLTLDTEGPNFTGPGLAKYQDIITVVDDNHHILSSQTQGEDGKWVPFMKADYRRK